MRIAYGSQLDMWFCELTVLQVGLLAHSHYQWSPHVDLDLGVTESDSQALINDHASKPTTLDPLTSRMLRAVREIAADEQVSDVRMAALQGTLGNKPVSAITVIIAFYNPAVCGMATLRIDVEDDFMPYLHCFPPPIG